MNCTVKSSENENASVQRDAGLIRRIASRDSAALGEFYDLYSGLMFSVAFHIVKNQAEAEDVLQETFSQIWEKASRFNPELGPCASWAVVLVRNRAIDHLRASIRRTRLSDDVAAEPAPLPSVRETANEMAVGHEEAGLVHAAVSELPAEQRRAIELAFFSGLTQHEIAEKLQEPLGTIKARIRRGLLKLRDRLEGNL